MMAVANDATGEFTITLDDVEYPVVFKEAGSSSWTIVVNGRSFAVKLVEDGVLVDGIAYDVTVDGERVREGDQSHMLKVAGLSVGRASPSESPGVRRSLDASEGAGAIVAIMPGQVTRVMVEEGQRIEEGQAVCVLEAMKMENELRAERAGVVKAVHVRSGDDVEKDQVLVQLE
jgi:biotin carboxyl carrier protein